MRALTADSPVQHLYLMSSCHRALYSTGASADAWFARAYFSSSICTDWPGACRSARYASKSAAAHLHTTLTFKCLPRETCPQSCRRGLQGQMSEDLQLHLQQLPQTLVYKGCSCQAGLACTACHMALNVVSTYTRTWLFLLSAASMHAGQVHV